MKIVVGKYSGFCNGVLYTVNKAKETLNGNNQVYSLGEIVHNERVIGDLAKDGMITIDTLAEAPNASKVIFRAHGEPKETYQLARAKNLEIIDLTCGKIKAIRLLIDKEKDDSFIIVIGKKNHPEVVGNVSYFNKGFIVEEEDDIKDAYLEFKKSNLDQVLIIAQTTFSSEKFDDLVTLIKGTFIDVDIYVEKTICTATEKRQNETEELAKKVDKMLIVGGRHSSNTKELFTISEKYCETYLIQDVMDLKDIFFNKDDNIGIMGGASTPEISVKEIINYLNKLYN